MISESFVGSVEPDEEYTGYSDQWGEFYDVSGNALGSGKVHEARLEEIGGLKERGTYVKCPLEECWRVTGKGPIRTRFVDVNIRAITNSPTTGLDL